MWGFKCSLEGVKVVVMCGWYMVVVGEGIGDVLCELCFIFYYEDMYDGGFLNEIGVVVSVWNLGFFDFVCRV